MSDKRVTKDEWVEIFRETGLSDEMMMRWHEVFEARAPEAHEAFLEWLGIEADEITRIRDTARGERA